MTDDLAGAPEAVARTDESPAPGQSLSMGRARRDLETRLNDHASIDRLADDVLLRLIGRLDDSGLGEIEVREDDWRIRLRRPAVRAPEARDVRHDRGDRTDRPARAGGPHHGMGDRARDRDRGESAAVRVSVADGLAGSNGSGPTAASVRREVAATSPAVGVFQPRPDIRTGSRVRAGDRLAIVDLLGVPQDVVAPADGVVMRTLVDPGEGVEYGQDLMLVEAVAPARAGASGAVFVDPPDRSPGGDPDSASGV